MWHQAKRNCTDRLVIDSKKKKNAFREINVLRRNFLKSKEEEFSDFCRMGIPSANNTLESMGEEGKVFPFIILTEFPQDSLSYHCLVILVACFRITHLSHHSLLAWAKCKVGGRPLQVSCLGKLRITSVRTHFRSCNALLSSHWMGWWDGLGI